ncbi:MAG TPA: amino acid racemase [Aliidongia sp.]|uniref:aspartate/glutamate racemase family protein n=1 Tax=Aliidongia sp. TaxID=1914230 RepID=UPI002DDCA313|nr:amino acid racemase [Aliidongia sp.]HEV2677025.1 amino acid racemase [Aliidongia sp.]
MSGFLGVLGGMGPAATADFLAKLVLMTPAASDQDHLPVIAQSIPTIPDRSSAILGQGPSPLPALTAGLARLRAAGCILAVMPCNSAHYWFDALAGTLPMLHIVDAVARSLRFQGIEGGPIGLLATGGTVAAGIYQDRLAGTGYDLVVPAPEDQVELVDPSIRAIKAGDLDGARVALRLALARLQTRGVGATVLGCTELPLVLRPEPAATHLLIDSTAALAQACVAALRDPVLGRAA